VLYQGSADNGLAFRILCANSIEVRPVAKNHNSRFVTGVNCKVSEAMPASRYVSPETAASDEVPALIRSYLTRVQSGTGKVVINSRASTTELGQFRAVGSLVLGEGWSGLEPWGVWSEGHRAVLYLKGENAGEILIEARGAISEIHPSLKTQFRIGSSETHFVFSLPETRFAQIKLPIPAELAGAPVIRIEMGIEAPKTPFEQTGGVSTDCRRVGIGLSSIQLLPSGTGDSPATDTMASKPPDHRATTVRQDDWSRKSVWGKANVIALTMVYNEGGALRRWLRHYGRHLGERNLLVIDDGSNDGSTDDVGLAGRLTIPRKLADDGERADFVSDLQRDLLRYFDAVIYADCDEFLVPDPRRYQSVREYVDNMTSDCVRPVAFNLIQIRDEELPLDPNRPILDQRSYCQFFTPECKPVLAKVPIRYEAGFHHCDRKALLDPDLLLVHSKLADFSAALARLSLTREMAWSERAIHAGWGNHSRSKDPELIGSFDTAERFLRSGGLAESLRPGELAARINSEIDQKGPPYRCVPSSGPLARVPEWLRGTV
jgi:hypothetical protein